MSSNSYFSAQEAARELNISVATLYAYVSRGLVRSEATPGKTKAKRYNAADIKKLKQKQAYRHHPGQAAQESLRLGMPVLDSGITLIEDGQLYYRGQNVLELATTRSFEEVATLLWNGSFAADQLFPSVPVPACKTNQPIENLSPVELFQVHLPVMAAEDLAGYDGSAAGLQRTGARILHFLTQIATGQDEIESIASALQRAWAPDYPEALQGIEAALILCADHELNVSAFTARCIASAGSTLYQVVLGGLSALQGVKHGGHAIRVQAMLEEVQGDVAAKMKKLIKRGEDPPGFWQPLYPNGDPRGRKLLELADELAIKPTPLLEAQQAAEFVNKNLARYPNLDFGLVTLCRALGLPEQASITLFALGRVSGWIAHALEQYETDQLIRPRARYVGEMPEN